MLMEKKLRYNLFSFISSFFCSFSVGHRTGYGKCDVSIYLQPSRSVPNGTDDGNCMHSPFPVGLAFRSLLVRSWSGRGWDDGRRRRKEKGIQLLAAPIKLLKHLLSPWVCWMLNADVYASYEVRGHMQIDKLLLFRFSCAANPSLLPMPTALIILIKWFRASIFPGTHCVPAMPNRMRDAGRRATAHRQVKIV